MTGGGLWGEPRLADLQGESDFPQRTGSLHCRCSMYSPCVFCWARPAQEGGLGGRKAFPLPTNCTQQPGGWMLYPCCTAAGPLVATVEAPVQTRDGNMTVPKPPSFPSTSGASLTHKNFSFYCVLQTWRFFSTELLQLSSLHRRFSPSVDAFPITVLAGLHAPKGLGKAQASTAPPSLPSLFCEMKAERAHK